MAALLRLKLSRTPPSLVPIFILSPPPPRVSLSIHVSSYEGDLGKFNPISGDLIVTGRAKDTIVLNNGENVEPQPLEVSGIASATVLLITC